MTSRIFRQVAMALYNGAQKLGITYNEINILVYYLLIPLTWTYFNRWGGNYQLNSVVVCVAVPILIYIGLVGMLIMR